MEGDLVIQGTDDFKMVRDCMATGIWQIPEAVFRELPMQYYLTSKGLRFKLDDDGNIMRREDGRPMIEKHKFRDSVVHGAGKELRKLMEQNKDVLIEKLASRLEELQAERTPTSAAPKNILEDMRRRVAEKEGDLANPRPNVRPAEQGRDHDESGAS